MRSSVPLGVIFALALSFLAGSAAAQSIAANVHQSTTQPTDGRFEIVQSPLAAKWTFRLDRYTGNLDAVSAMKMGG